MATERRARIDDKAVKQLLRDSATGITWDTELRGFGVRITDGGCVAFILDYRVSDRKRRYTIARYPVLTASAARDEAADWKRRIRNGEDPLEAKRSDREAPTVADLASEYLSRYAEVHKRQSSVSDDRRMLDGIIRPRLGALQLQALTRRDIEALHASLKATPYRANRILSLLSKMFSLAVDWKWRTDNPVRGIQRFHEERSERWLSVDELQRFTKALEKYHDQNAANALRLLLLTGAREGEVLSADWQQFDLERGVWTKPSHHTKQKRTEFVPLSESACTLLRGMKPRTAGPLFPGAKEGTARTTLRRPFVQVCKAAGLVEARTITGKRGELTRYRPTLHVHSLRHTYASHLVSSGLSLQIVGKLLGHTQPQTTNRYAHLADAALRDATNKFAQIVGSNRRTK